MRLRLIAVGTKMPAWVDEGWETYRRRLGRDLQLDLVEIEPGYRGGGADPMRARQDECRRLLKAVPRGWTTIALDEGGKPWSTQEWTRYLRDCMRDGEDLALLVGGPDGLDPHCLSAGPRRVSLSPLTLPHPLVRVVVAEQIYRVWSLLHSHPYHR